LGPDWIPVQASSLSEKIKISCFDELYVRSGGFFKPKRLFFEVEQIFIKNLNFSFISLQFFSAFDNKKAVFWIRILILALDPVRI
jgi:hypothetical protein